MIYPFKLTKNSDQIKGSYLDPALLREFFVSASENERRGIIRLWITEGIPFAFRGSPLLYEETRTFIAKGVNVHTKEVTLVGSARAGYSLTKKKWGVPFTQPGSDLDFTIVSNDLFERLTKDFQAWVRDIQAKRTLPANTQQMRSWLAAIGTIDKNITRGYINTRHLLSDDKYPTPRKCNSTMRLLGKILKETPGAPVVSDVSVRVYSDWRRCVDQLRENFMVALIW